MESLYSALIALLMGGVALGVGSSTLAIASFLVAIADKKIDEGERRMLGVIYIALRVAMVLIALTLGCLTWLYPGTLSVGMYMWVPVAVLYGNAVLMTKHLITPKLGPAVQAASWYTLGFLMVVEAFGLVTMTPVLFVTVYVTDFILAVLVVNFFIARSVRGS